MDKPIEKIFTDDDDDDDDDKEEEYDDVGDYFGESTDFEDDTDKEN